MKRLLFMDRRRTMLQAADLESIPARQDWQVDRVISINEMVNAAMKPCLHPYDGVVLCFDHRDQDPVDLIRFVIKYKPQLPVAVLVQEYELVRMQLHLRGIVCRIVTPAGLTEAF